MQPRLRAALAFPLFFSVLIPPAQAARLPSMPDGTDSQLRHLRAVEGLREEEEFRAGPIEVRLHTTAGARELVEKKTLDEADSGATLDGIVKFAKDAFAEGLEAFVTLWGSSRELPIVEVEVVLLDMGEDRKSTICEVTQFTHLIRCDLRRWHKISRGRQRPHGILSPIHEFTHVVNYRTDPQETKFHREFAAILIECGRLIHQLGAPWFTGKYLPLVTAPIKTKDELLATDYASHDALRQLAFALYKGVENDTYVAPGKSIDAFTIAYLRNPLSGDAGFDASAREADLTLPDGTSLTLNQLRKDAHSAQP